MREETPAYLRALTFPRFALAILVVVYHFGLHLPIFESSAWSEFFHQGAVAVSFFFFLSGCVLAYNYGVNTSTRSFLLKRVFRLYPTYLITYILVLCALNWWENYGFQWFVWPNLVGIQSWFPGYALEVNFPAWSLSVEFFFYLCFPLILWFYKRLKSIHFFILGGIIVLLGGLEHYIAVTEYYDPDRFFLEQFILHFPLFHFSTFLAGFICGKGIHWLKKKNINSWLYSFLAVIGILSFFITLNTDNYYREFAHNGGLIPIFAMICIGLALDQRFFYYLFGWRPLQFLGNISYSIYMWQFPIYLIFSQSREADLLSTSSFFLYLSILIIWSALIYTVFEKPVRQKLTHLFVYRS